MPPYSKSDTEFRLFLIPLLLFAGMLLQRVEQRASYSEPPASVPGPIEPGAENAASATSIEALSSSGPDSPVVTRTGPSGALGRLQETHYQLNIPHPAAMVEAGGWPWNSLAARIQVVEGSPPRSEPLRDDAPARAPPFLLD